MKPTIISDAFRRMEGVLCWGTHYSPLLNLSMSFGQPKLRIREPYETKSNSEFIRRLARLRNVVVKGEWWLWLQGCFWQLRRGDVQLARNSSSRQRMREALLELEGQRLVSLEIEPDHGRTRFGFDLGCSLICRRMSATDDMALWTLYKPRGYVLSIFPDGTFSHERSHGSGETHYKLEHISLTMGTAAKGRQ